MKSLNPYLSFHGRCEEALEFYAAAMNGKIESLQRFSDAPGGGMEGADPNGVMHAEFRADDVFLMASDGPPGESKSGNLVSLSISLDDTVEQKRVFDALAEGGEVTMPLEKQFWGAVFGQLTDKFGVHWMLNCQTG